MRRQYSQKALLMQTALYHIKFLLEPSTRKTNNSNKIYAVDLNTNLTKDTQTDDMCSYKKMFHIIYYEGIAKKSVKNNTVL